MPLFLLQKTAENDALPATKGLMHTMTSFLSEGMYNSQEFVHLRENLIQDRNLERGTAEKGEKTWHSISAF